MVAPLTSRGAACHEVCSVQLGQMLLQPSFGCNFGWKWKARHRRTCARSLLVVSQVFVCCCSADFCHIPFLFQLLDLWVLQGAAVRRRGAPDSSSEADARDQEPTVPLLRLHTAVQVSFKEYTWQSALCLLHKEPFVTPADLLFIFRSVDKVVLIQTCDFWLNRFLSNRFCKIKLFWIASDLQQEPVSSWSVGLVSGNGSWAALGVCGTSWRIHEQEMFDRKEPLCLKSHLWRGTNTKFSFWNQKKRQGIRAPICPHGCQKEKWETEWRWCVIDSSQLFDKARKMWIKLRAKSIVPNFHFFGTECVASFCQKKKRNEIIQKSWTPFDKTKSGVLVSTQEGTSRSQLHLFLCMTLRSERFSGRKRRNTGQSPHNREGH